ncbi:hypothetical protein EV363DRAFT_811142 [Boletus edulis]|uniref:Uncharacterized protein n=1 Tax=Boletus edulis BED1 TaxID=1328754 RepID=A0AAD4BHQ3_BOLED|nr:hypothetical protein EV363DRAFT_1241933 [Boletus edulis]KAF8122830.1 hypothetical protein EV363DRAFT_811142 [Boletus edulis]KAF8430876.1 hypothetical protein L210DRAFT_3019553 [Boletus edulis BED1]
MTAAFMSNPLSPFNPGVRPPSRLDRGGGGTPPGSSKVSSYMSPFNVRHDSERGYQPYSQNYILPVHSGFSLSAATARGDMDYKPASHRDPRPSVPPVRDAPRKLVKPPPPSHAHVQEERERGRERERERERDRGYRDTRRFGFIHPGPVPDTYIYERSIASSKSDPYHEYYPPLSDSTGSEIDSLFSHNSSASSNSSVDDDCPPRGMLQVARTTPERRPSFGHGHGGQRSGTPFPVSYHTCPTCSEMSSSPPPRAAGRSDGGPHGSRPLPAPPVSSRVRKDSLVLASERSVPPQATRPRLPQLRIGDRPAYPVDAPPSAWCTAETGGYPSGLPPPLARSSSLRSSASAGSSSHGVVPPPPGLNIHWDYSQTIDITADPPHRLPNRRNSDGDQGQILLPRPRRSSTVPPPRSIRWSEELVCPSPILPSQRRKGWFNRRGDQLWRNDGSYKPPAPGEDYPEDLDDYPEPNGGWQNEDGIRIDINRRLIPKAPLRSVLKRTNYCKENSIIAGYLTNGQESPTSDDD